MHCGHLPVHAAVMEVGKQLWVNNFCLLCLKNRPFAMEHFLIVPIGTGHILHNMKDLIKTSC